MRRFDVFADATVDVDYRYRARLERGFTGLLYLLIDGAVIRLFVAGYGSSCARTDTLLT